MSSRADLEGLKVLLVDDHRDSAESLSTLLSTFGCRPSVCFDASSALLSVEAITPDVVVLDIRLPDMSGTELCGRLRALESLRSAALIALTGAADDATLDEVREAGFHVTLTKPVELETLLRVLAEAASAR